MSFSVLGLGTAVPPTTISREQGIRVAQAICPDPFIRDRLADLNNHSGIELRRTALGQDVLNDVLQGTRHSGSPFLPRGSSGDRGPTTAQRMQIYRKQAGPLAIAAAQRALADAHLPPSAVTDLVTISCTGFSAPGCDVELIAALGLSPCVERTHVGFMGCHGALNGLRVARALADSDPARCVLLCAVELCSLHYDYGAEMQKLISNALFADGAAALVGRADDDRDAWHLVANGSCLFPNTTSAMTWNIADHGFEMTLATRVPRLIEAHLRPWFEAFLASVGLRIGDVRSWAVHPGGPRILESVGAALALPSDSLSTAREVLANYGNMSSATVLFILDLLRRRAAPRPCVALGFGPGLTAEVAIFR